MPLPLRSLLFGPAPGPDRIFFHGVWFRGHTNQRYAALLPRLARVDPFMLTCSSRRIPRGVQVRALRKTADRRYRMVFTAARRHYRLYFSTAPVQLPYIRGPVVVDIDDPRFTHREVELLSLPNVRAYVVTAESAARRFQDLGLDKPFHVISQGISNSDVDPIRVDDVAARRRGDDDIVVGYVAAYLVSSGDRGGDMAPYNVDHLLELWDQIHAAHPRARLWLIGEPGERVRRRCAGRDDILLLGRLSRSETLAHISNFDVALYPRRVDHAPFAIKLAEYMGTGVPTVAYDLQVTRILMETGAGVLASTPSQFVEAVRWLLAEPAQRAQFAAAAVTAGRAFDWDNLAARYQREILDVHLV